MRKVIVLFDEQYDDVDILVVPERIAENINYYGQSYCRWLESPEVDPKLCTIVNGVKCTILETEGFVGWLNSNVIKDDEEKATILQTNTVFCEGYPVVEF